jgi:hypothetical protein
MGATTGRPRPMTAPSRWNLAARVVLVVLGAIGLLSGCYVVLRDQDGTATAALIGISALLLFLGIFIDRIASVSHGSTEVKFLLEGAKDAAARGDDAAHSALVQAAVDVAQASAGLDPDIHVSDESRVHDVAVLNAVNEPDEVEAVEQIRRPVEAVAIVAGRRIGVEPRHRLRKLDSIVRRLEREKVAGKLPVDALLVVPRLDADDPRVAKGQRRLREELDIPVMVVGWHAEDDPAPLHDAIRALVAER